MHAILRGEGRIIEKKGQSKKCGAGEKIKKNAQLTPGKIV
jgi:hypothetical protein